MEIKICGMRTIQDIEYMNIYKPEYVGFILAPSKRQITPNLCKELISKLDENIIKVGVFVNTSSEKINQIVSFCGLDIAQLHGEEKPYECDKIEASVWKAFRIRSKKDIEKIDDYNVDGCLLDAYDKNAYGGTGKSFSWQLIKDLDIKRKLILAGGIKLENVENTMTIDGIKCIDVSSGVETNGIKDKDKIREIIERVRK